MFNILRKYISFLNSSDCIPCAFLGTMIALCGGVVGVTSTLAGLTGDIQGGSEAAQAALEFGIVTLLLSFSGVLVKGLDLYSKWVINKITDGDITQSFLESKGIELDDPYTCLALGAHALILGCFVLLFINYPVIIGTGTLIILTPVVLQYIIIRLAAKVYSVNKKLKAHVKNEQVHKKVT